MAESTSSDTNIPEATDAHTEVSGSAVRPEPETRRVRVTYVPRGYGLALAIDDNDESTEDHADGVLRVTDAVITLEIPTVDGRPAVLAWDPAEVTWDAVAV